MKESSTGQREREKETRTLFQEVVEVLLRFDDLLRYRIHLSLSHILKPRTREFVETQAISLMKLLVGWIAVV